MAVGQDDANEGHADGECVEHVWQLRQLVLSREPVREYECARPGCDATVVKGRSTIR